MRGSLPPQNSTLHAVVSEGSYLSGGTIFRHEEEGEVEPGPCNHLRRGLVHCGQWAKGRPCLAVRRRVDAVSYEADLRRRVRRPDNGEARAQLG